MTDSSGVWQLRYDVLSVRVLAAVAIARRAGTLKPEVHLFLGDRYERLADRHGRRGARRRARRLAEKAHWHYAQAGFDDVPPRRRHGDAASPAPGVHRRPEKRSASPRPRHRCVDSRPVASS